MHLNAKKEIQTKKLLIRLVLLSLVVVFHLSITAIISYSATETGPFLKSVAITDSAGNNSPPIADFSYTQNGDIINFDASGSTDPDGTITQYKWKIGNTGVAEGISVTYSITDELPITVSLTINDDKQGIAIVQKVIEDIELTNLLPQNYDTTHITIGSQYYIDRYFTVTDIPKDLDGLLAIKTANNDKSLTAGSYVTFTTNRQLIVYICYDSRATTTPSWLKNDYEPTSYVIDTTDVQHRVWKREFPAGDIKIPANYYGNPTGVRSNYFILLK